MPFAYMPMQWGYLNVSVIRRLVAFNMELSNYAYILRKELVENAHTCWDVEGDNCVCVIMLKYILSLVQIYE